MRYVVKAKINKETEAGTWFHVFVPGEFLKAETEKCAVGGIFTGEFRIDDGRTISADQRKKAHATLRDMADHQGYPAEEYKGLMKFGYIAATGDDDFSFSNCSMTTARQFINYILDFALQWGVPLTEALIDRCDDIDAAIYATLRRKKCVVCGATGEVHHWDAIGMGRDRRTVDDSLLRKICLCRKHHGEAHQIGRDSFEKKYHVYGIIYNEG